MAFKDSLHIPALLCGVPRDIAARAKGLARAAANTRNWNVALEGLQWLPVDQTPGQLVLDDAFRTLIGEHVMLSKFMPALMLACREACHHDNKEVYMLFRDLVLTGVEWFWFSLALLGYGFPFFPEVELEADERQQRSRAILKKLLRWWPSFLQVQHRFGTTYVGPWDRWAAVPIQLCARGGMPVDEARRLFMLQPSAAGEEIAKWLTDSP